MLVDLHAHYPMHLVPETRKGFWDLIRTPGGRKRLTDIFRATLVGFAGRYGNYESPSSGPRVTVPLLRAGEVGVALSVLHAPLDEWDVTLRYPGLPRDSYFEAILRQLEDVEREIAGNFAGEAVIARNPAELDAAIAAGKLALVHALEGGFSLGSTPERAGDAVRALADRGCAYITLAHLVYRQVATNVNAIPFLPDLIYDLIFPQPDIGLTPIGRAAIEAMVESGVILDLSHMSAPALEETFALLDRVDPEKSVAVLASHVAYRFGRQDYNLDEATVRRIAERDGVVGLILAEHQIADGLPHPHSLEDSIATLGKHVDRIHEITGTHRHTAIGTDLDGFIKPVIPGLEDASRCNQIEAGLTRTHGAETAAEITSANALRLLREHWRGAPAS